MTARSDSVEVARPRTITGRRVVLVVPENAAPSVLSFVEEIKNLLGTRFIVRVEHLDKDLTPVEIRLNDFPFVLKILG